MCDVYFLQMMSCVLLRKDKMMKHNFLFCISLLPALQFTLCTAPHSSPATTRANLSVFVLFSMKLFSSSLPGNGKFHNWTNRNGSDGMPMKWLTSSSIYQFYCATHYWMEKNVSYRNRQMDRHYFTLHCRDAEIFPRTLV